MSEDVFLEGERTLRVKAVTMYVTDIIVYVILFLLVVFVPSLLIPVHPVLDKLMGFFHVSWRYHVFTGVLVFVLFLIDMLVIIPLRLFISR